MPASPTVLRLVPSGTYAVGSGQFDDGAGTPVTEAILRSFCNTPYPITSGKLDVKNTWRPDSADGVCVYGWQIDTGSNFQVDLEFVWADTITGIGISLCGDVDRGSFISYILTSVFAPTYPYAAWVLCHQPDGVDNGSAHLDLPGDGAFVAGNIIKMRLNGTAGANPGITVKIRRELSDTTLVYDYTAVSALNGINLKDYYSLWDLATDGCRVGMYLNGFNSGTSSIPITSFVVSAVKRAETLPTIPIKFGVVSDSNSSLMPVTASTRQKLAMPLSMDVALVSLPQYNGHEALKGFGRAASTSASIIDAATYVGNSSSGLTIAIIMTGTNDANQASPTSKATYKANVNAIVDLFHVDCKILFVTPAKIDTAYKTVGNAALITYGEALDEIVTARNATTARRTYKVSLQSFDPTTIADGLHWSKNTSRMPEASVIIGAGIVYLLSIPVISAASLGAGGYIVSVTLTYACTNSTGFVLRVNGGSVGFSISGSGTSRTLTASSTIYSFDDVTIDYVPGNITNTSTGIGIIAFYDFPVVNNSTAALFPMPPGGGDPSAAPGTPSHDGITPPVSLGGGVPQTPSALRDIFLPPTDGSRIRLNIGIEIVRWPVGSQYPTSRKQVFDNDWFDLKFTYQRRGGYGSFSFQAIPDLVDEIQEDDVILIYAGPTVIFTGRLESVLLDYNTDTKVYSCSGTESLLSLKSLPVSIGPFDAPVRVDWVLPKLVAQLKKDYPYIVATTISYGDITDTITSVNCANKTYFEAFDELAGHCVTPMCWGIRYITSTQQFEFYFLKLNSTSGYQNISRFDVKGYTEEFDTTQLFTEIEIKGNIDPKYPSLYSNYSMEDCRMNSDTVTWNEIPLPDAGFEDNAWGWTDTTGWTLSAGASIKSTGGDAGTVEARSGLKCLEIDAINEKAVYSVTKLDPYDGIFYRFAFWYRPEINASTGSPPVVRCNVIWKNVSAATLVTDSFYTDPQTAKSWFYKYVELQAPVNATNYTIELIGSSGTFSTSDGGIHIDDFKVFKRDLPYPLNWQVDTKGTATVTTYEFELDTAHHGFTFLRIRAVASSTSNYVRLYNIQTQNIIGGQQVKASARIRKVGSETWPNIQFVAEFYKPSTPTTDPPTLISTFTSDIFISAPTDWTYTSTSFAAPNSTTFAICYYRIIQNGSVDFDELCLRDALETGTDEYGDHVDIIRDAATLVASEPYTSSIATYGRRRKILDAAVATIADAEKAGKAWLLANVRFNKSPRITELIETYEDVPNITKTFRIIETNKVFPVESIDVTIGDTYDKISSLQYRTPDIADIVNNIQEKGPKIF